MEQSERARNAQTGGFVQIAYGLRLRIMRDIEARTGVRFSGAQREMEATPGGFNGLEAGMMQQGAHVFPERGRAPRIGRFGRRSVRAGQLADVVIEGIAARPLGNL